MFYFKVDSNGNPLRIPQTENEIKVELFNQGTILPADSSGWLVENEYAEQNTTLNTTYETHYQTYHSTSHITYG